MKIKKKEKEGRRKKKGRRKRKKEEGRKRKKDSIHFTGHPPSVAVIELEQ